MNIFFIAQIFGIIAWIFFLISYFSKRINKVIFLQFISSIFYCLNYLLLGAWSGLFVSIFEGCKELGFYFTDKDRYIFLSTIPIYIIIAIISENSFLMIIPIIASIIDGYGIIKNRNTTVICGLISNSLWIIYDLFYNNFASVLSDLTIVILNFGIIIYGYSKFLESKNIYTTNQKKLSKNDLNTIYNLDKQYYDSNNCWNLKKLEDIYNKENDSYILVKNKNKIIGYVNILSIKKEIYNIIMNSNTLFDDLIDSFIIPYNQKNQNYYITINSIVLKNEYQNKIILEKIIKAIKKFIINKEKQGYHIEGINAYTVNSLEKQIIEKLNFEKVKKITNESFLYEKI